MTAAAFAAVDLGATSGRVMIGRADRDVLALEPVARFANRPIETADGLHWDFSALHRRVLDGLGDAVRAEPGIVTVGIDSWAVDYGLLASGRAMGEPFHYRDERSLRGVERVHARIPFAALYRRNGLQFLPFTTVYQLAADAALAQADTALLIPDLLAFHLTGVRVAEATNASTTGLLDASAGRWDAELLRLLELPERLLPEICPPGTPLGGLQDAAADVVGARLEVVAVGSHDTASAVVAVPMGDPSVAAYISCGTWGLVGVELESPLMTDAARDAGFTNEGGVDGRTRFLRNVAGLWLLSETVRAWEEEDAAPVELPALLQAAASVSGRVPVFDADDPRLSAPGDMAARIAAVLREQGDGVPASRAEFARCIVESIAAAFARALDDLQRVTGRTLQVVHLVGGGALNTLLCQATADGAGLPVLAGPVEATALGNVLVQARAAGSVGGSLESLRDLVARTHEVRRFRPRTRRDEADWKACRTPSRPDRA